VTEAGALDAIDRILNRGGDADDVLREVVGVLPAQVSGLVWAGVSFREEGRFVAGPSAGEPDESQRVRVPVSYRGEQVGELAVDGEAGSAFLERVATLISAHVLIGWDTRGERWEP
jgi:putative methionine-R-sulfoxide reductase with GAF domain